MRIFFVTPEAVPCSRAGGLGDISYHLPKALTAMGHTVTVLVPKYHSDEDFPLTPLPELGQEIDLSISRRMAEFYEYRLEEQHQLILVGCDDLFNRPGIYGNEFGDYDDNAERFIFFSKAAFKAIDRIVSLSGSSAPVIIHSHDWATGLVSMLAKVLIDDHPALKAAGTVFTYHNLANQGTFPYYDFTMTGLDWSYFTFKGLEFHGQLNLTKAGFLGAHLITTVSHKYARETLGQEMGMGLEGVLKERRRDIRSVLHGVDYNLWDPKGDSYLPATYDLNDLSGKAVCRKNLATLFGLTEDEMPIVSMVSRLLSRKGLDLIAKAMPDLLKLPLKLVFMGTGEDHYLSFLKETAQQNPDRVGLKLAYDPALTHQIVAGSDIFLAPSRFEPCGLEQLYALKYGAVPLVRATGGLDDTVTDILSYPDTGTGYKFIDYTPEALSQALSLAISDFKDKNKWHSLMRRGMMEDFSWQRSASAYEEIYHQALAVAAGERQVI